MAGVYNATAQGTEEKLGKLNNAGMYDPETIAALGIDPNSVPWLNLKKCGYDKNMNLINGPATPSQLKTGIRKQLRIQDMQDAMNTFTWYNLPNGLTGQLIERILYYRGQGVFFYLEATDKFYFLPYALGSKGIDCYGRYQSVKPVPFTGAADEGKSEKEFIPGLDLDVYYDIVLTQLSAENILKSGVIIRDYANQMSQTIIPRQIVNDPILDLESDMLPFARTCLLNSTGISGLRVQNATDTQNVDIASRAINKAAIEGRKFVPIIGQMEFQELTGDKTVTADQFLMAMQSIDNYRLSTHGLDSGGIFQKQAHMLESENQMNSSKSSFTLQDRLWQRQNACDIINSLTGLGIWVDVSQSAAGIDKDMDGEMLDNDPSTVSYASNEMGGTEYDD